MHPDGSRAHRRLSSAGTDGLGAAILARRPVAGVRLDGVGAAGGLCPTFSRTRSGCPGLFRRRRAADMVCDETRNRLWPRGTVNDRTLRGRGRTSSSENATAMAWRPLSDTRTCPHVRPASRWRTRRAGACDGTSRHATCRAVRLQLLRRVATPRAWKSVDAFTLIASTSNSALLESIECGGFHGYSTRRVGRQKPSVQNRTCESKSRDDNSRTHLHAVVWLASLMTIGLCDARSRRISRRAQRATTANYCFVRSFGLSGELAEREGFISIARANSNALRHFAGQTTDPVGLGVFVPFRFFIDLFTAPEAFAMVATHERDAPECRAVTTSDSW